MMNVSGYIRINVVLGYSFNIRYNYMIVPTRYFKECEISESQNDMRFNKVLLYFELLIS